MPLKMMPLSCPPSLAEVLGRCDIQKRCPLSPPYERAALFLRTTSETWLRWMTSPSFLPFYHQRPRCHSLIWKAICKLTELLSLLKREKKNQKQGSFSKEKLPLGGSLRLLQFWTICQVQKLDRCWHWAYKTLLDLAFSLSSVFSDGILPCTPCIWELEDLTLVCVRLSDRHGNGFCSLSSS